MNDYLNQFGIIWYSALIIFRERHDSSTSAFSGGGFGKIDETAAQQRLTRGSVYTRVESALGDSWRGIIQRRPVQRALRPRIAGPTQISHLGPGP